VLMLGAVILRTSEDHEAAILLGEAAPIHGRRPLIFGCLLIAVPALALARLTQHALEELAVLELVLDGVAVIGARHFQELLEVAGIALSLARGQPPRPCWGWHDANPSSSFSSTLRRGPHPGIPA
jgi:hypothetical protein